MAWHLIEKDGERQWIEAVERKAKGRALAPQGHDDAELIEVRDTPPEKDEAGEAELQARHAQAWIDRLPLGVLDLLVAAVAAKLGESDGGKRQPPHGAGEGNA